MPLAFSTFDYTPSFVLTPDSINASHIVNGSIKGEDMISNAITENKILNGAISQVKLDATLNALIASFEARISALENA